VPGVSPIPDYAQQPGEREPDHVVRLLTGHGFDWVDMGFGKATEVQAMTGLRGTLEKVARTLASRQPDLGARSMVGAAGRFGVDAFYYRPARDAVWVLFGRGLEVGGSTSVVETGWFRLGGAVILQNLLIAISSDPSPVSLLPVAGVDFVPASIGSSLFQPSFQARAGYLFDFTDEGCSGPAGETIGGCSRPEVEAGAAAVIAGLVRFQITFQWYPPARGAPGLWALAPSMGLQLGF
jgi:hypothetical protein